MTKKQKGFSLIELLIVVAIILIIAAIAIPNLLRARMAANEASAVGSVRTLVTANVTYNSTWGNGFSPDLPTLGGALGAAATCGAAELVDPLLSAAPNQKSGYTLSYSLTNPNAAAAPGCGAPGGQSFAFTAKPMLPGSTGQSSFCAAEDGVVRRDPLNGMGAGETDLICQTFSSLQ